MVTVFGVGIRDFLLGIFVTWNIASNSGMWTPERKGLFLSRISGVIHHCLSGFLAFCRAASPPVFGNEQHDYILTNPRRSLVGRYALDFGRRIPRPRCLISHHVNAVQPQKLVKLSE